MMYSESQQKKIFKKSKDLLKEEMFIDETRANELISDLRGVIEFHEWRYYVKNDPLVSDFEYDMLYKKLEKLELDFPGLIVPESPTQRVSTDLVDGFPTVSHLTPMLSLSNSYDANDLNDFDAQVKKLSGLEGDIEYVVEPKFDGSSIGLVYENDKFVRGATRGDGANGEDITHNTRVINSIPLHSKFSELGISKVELRGEVMIRKDHFEEINAKREKEGQSLYANPRNLAAGGLRMKDPNQVKERNLDAFIYQVGFAEDTNNENRLNIFHNHSETIDLLSQLGFKVPVEETKVCKNIEEVIEYCKHWADKRDDYPFEIDGMVVKVNSLDIQNKLGYTSHHPRWAIAYKFKAKQAITTLKSIEYQIGRTGSITPVAKLEPVELAGVTISSVSLHNEEFISSKDIRIGDKVIVERAGDVIPYIVKSLPDLREENQVSIIFPKECPSCKTVLVKDESEAVWRCTNPTCEAVQLQKMIYHVSKPAMDIDGFGKSLVERFYELGMIHDISDIYNLDYEKIANLEGLGEKSAANLQKAIESAKKNPLYRLIIGQSIHHVGRKASKLLAEISSSIYDLSKISLEELIEIKDIGKVVANNVIEYFGKEENLEVIRKMEAFGVNVCQTEEDKPKQLNTEGVFFGKTILFTGKLELMSRNEAKSKAEEAGAKNMSAVSSRLDILVAGAKAGSKLKKAKELGTVLIMTEEEFLNELEK